MHLPMHRPVLAGDGTPVGQLERVVIDPRIEEVTDLLVTRRPGDAMGRLVPVGLVRDADDDAVLLRITSAQLSDFPEAPTIAYVPLESVERGPLVGWRGPPDYTERDILVPAELLYDTPVRPFAPQFVQEGGLLGPAAVDVALGTVVECSDGLAGHIVEVQMHPPSQAVRSIVVAPAAGGPARVVPIDVVAELTPGVVRLTLTRSEFLAHPAHRTEE